ncbi:MAG: choice-of-anchor D domain-containing protein, partial [Acidobacteriaceae bacterium]
YIESTVAAGVGGWGVAVDGAGNVYTSDGYVVLQEAISEAGDGYYAQSTFADATTHDNNWSPAGLAVDGLGNVYIADDGEELIVKEIRSGTGYTESTVADIGDPTWGLAVDGSGNVYETDVFGDVVWKETPAGTSYTQSSIGSGLGLNAEGGWGPRGVAVDGAGDLYVTDVPTGTIVKETLSGSRYVQSTAAGGFDLPYGVAVDGPGNVYVTDSSGNLRKLDFADPPSLSFATATPLGLIDTTDGTQTVQILNAGNATLKLSAIAWPPDFAAASGDAKACTASTSLSHAQWCDLPIEFAPLQTGALSEQIVLTDNSSNVAGSRQIITVSGTALPPPTPTYFSIASTASSASVVVGVPFTITVTALSSSNLVASRYDGTISFTSSDPGFVNPGPITLVDGTGQATVTLQTVGTETITATDTTTSALTGSGSFNVVPMPIVPASGTPSSVNFGSQAVGSTSAAQTLTFSIPANTTVSSIAVLTQGAPNLDFVNAAGSTCAAQAYATAANCTVNVAFTPKFPGTRYGAVSFYDGGYALATVYLYGTGAGPQIIYAPGQQSVVANQAGYTLALDGSGDLYVNTGNSVVKDTLSGGTYTESTIVGGLSAASGLAVDGAGNVYISNAANNTTLKETVSGGSYTQSIVADSINNGLSNPAGVAVDGSGNVYIADFNNHRVVKETLSPSGYVQSTVASGFVNPGDVAVDGAGNLYVADFMGNIVVKETPSGGSYTQSTVMDPAVRPNSVRVDGVGNVYITNEGTITVNKATPSGAGYVLSVVADSSPTYGLAFPNGVAVDGSGNAYISDLGGDNRVLKEDLADPPSLSFAATSVKGPVVSYTPQTVTVSNDGNAPLTFPALNAGENPSISSDFVLSSDSGSACPTVTPGSAPGTLAAGSSCLLTINFQPAEATGTLTGSLILTDNTLNAAAPNYATQAIQLTGSVPAIPPFGALNPVIDSVTGSTTVGQADSLEVTGWVADAIDGAPLSNVKVYIDGNLAGTPTLGIPRYGVAVAYNNPAFLDSGYQLLYPASSLSVGTHAVTVVAVDSGGRSKTFGPVSFTVAATAGASPPFGSLGPVEDNVTFSNTVGQSDSLDVKGWVADPADGSPLSNVKVYIDGVLAGTPTLGLASPDVVAAYNNAAYAHARFEFLDSASSLALGPHKLTVVAVDSGGRSTTLNPRSFTVAATAGAGPPVGGLAQVIDSTTLSTTVSPSDSVLVTGWVADPTDGSPLSNVKVYVDGVLTGTPTLGLVSRSLATQYNNPAWSHARYQFLDPASGLAAGTHWATVVAIDSGGRSTTFGPSIFTVQ